VFDRFYRATATRSLPGSGLGLAIVKQFADDHNAVVSITNTPGGGATVSLSFENRVN
jgi:two-component system sensor histidine kinase MprB